MKAIAYFAICLMITTGFVLQNVNTKHVGISQEKGTIIACSREKNKDNDRSDQTS